VDAAIAINISWKGGFMDADIPEIMKRRWTIHILFGRVHSNAHLRDLFAIRVEKRRHVPRSLENFSRGAFVAVIM